MHNVIIFGDIHTDPACYQAITKLLPELKANGYGTVYMETSPQSIDKIMENIEFDIAHLEAFPDGHVPEKNKITEKQENVLKSYASYNDFPNQAVKYAKERLKFLIGDGRLEWCKARKAMLEAAIELEIKLIYVDVNNPGSYDYAGGIGIRTKYMVDGIQEKLVNSTSSKSIVITGFAHVIDTWEDDTTNGWKYNRGMIRMFAKNQNINVDHCFLIYSKNTAQKQRALRDISVCASEIIQKIKIADFLNQSLPPACNLQTLISICSVLTVEEDTAKVGQYRAIVPKLEKFTAGYARALVDYITDLGGKEIQQVHNGLFIQFEISSCILSEERLKRLSLERALFQITLNASEIKELEEKILGITIENISNKETLFTFVANNQEIKDMINSTCSEIIKSQNQEMHHATLPSAAGPFSTLSEKENKKAAIITSDNPLAFDDPSSQKMEKSTIEEEKSNWARFFNSKIIDPNQKKLKNNTRITAEFSPKEIDDIKKEFPECKLQ